MIILQHHQNVSIKICILRNMKSITVQHEAASRKSILRKRGTHRSQNSHSLRKH